MIENWPVLSFCGQDIYWTRVSANYEVQIFCGSRKTVLASRSRTHEGEENRFAVEERLQTLDGFVLCSCGRTTHRLETNMISKRPTSARFFVISLQSPKSYSRLSVQSLPTHTMTG